MRAEQIPFREVLAALVDLADAADLAVMLVGATARDIALADGGSDAALRATNDVDIAVAVENTAAFARLISGLTPVAPGHAHKFIVEGIEVDIVPFGGIESDDRTITWPDGAVMNTLGFTEALESALRINLGDGRVLRVASVVAQTALKLFAWSDRRASTQHDAVDLRALVLAYSEGDRLDQIYAEERLDVLIRYDYDIRAAGAHQLGKDISVLMGSPVAARCAQVLDDPVAGQTELVLAMRVEPNENARLLAALRAGLR